MLTLSDAEIEASVAYYRDVLARQPRLDFSKRWVVLMVRALTMLAFLDRRPLQAHGLTAESTRVAANGRSVAVRIIRPKGPARAILVDIHGGGWTLGRAVIDDPLNAPFAAAGCAVVSVDYRLAPDHPFAAVIDDCETALAWVLTEGATTFGATPVLLTGDSAGAHLSVAAALRCRDAGLSLAQVKAMALFYGCYDLSATPSVRNARADTLVMNGASLPAFFQRVTGGLSETARRDPALSPLYADLAGLPPALVIVGAADPLIDDSTLIAEKLKAAGNEAELLVVPQAPHSFNRFPHVVAERVNAYVRAWLLARAG